MAGKKNEETDLDTGTDGNAADAPEREQTGQGTHIATQRGYAKGVIVERGEPVPAGIAVSTEWMAPKEEAEEALAETEE